MSVAIVIPTYNRIDTLRRLLPGYLAQPGLSELILVDDGSREPVTHERLGVSTDGIVRIVRNMRSLGLPGARNVGVDASRSAFVLFGEDDVELSEGHIEALLSERSRLGADLIAGRLVQQLSDESMETAFARAEASGAPLFSRRLMTVNTSVLREATEVPCAHAIMMAPRELLLQFRFSTRIGGPSFMREDQEMQLCLRRNGFKLWVTRAAQALHLAKATTAGGGTRGYGSLAVQLASGSVNAWQVLREYHEELAPFFPGLTADEMVRRATRSYLEVETKNFLRARLPLFDRAVRALRGSA
jgi:glycosyltransferase involved in cell wall biosynthesis